MQCELCGQEMDPCGLDWRICADCQAAIDRVNDELDESEQAEASGAASPEQWHSQPGTWDRVAEALDKRESEARGDV